MTTLTHVIDARRCGVYRIAGAPPAVSSKILRLNIPAVRGKAELMDAFARTANLPAWFGHNWDALEESLLDLDAARGDGVLVLLLEITTLARRDADAWHTLLVLLGDVAEEWERRGGLFVVLVPDDAPGVESLPRIAGD